MLLEESLEPEDGPGIIRINRTAKLKLAHKQFLQNLLDDPSYLGGLTDTTERLIYHDDPKIQTVQSVYCECGCWRGAQS